MNTILDLIREKAAKLGCLILLGTFMGITVLVVRRFLTGFGYDKGTSWKIADQAGNAVGITVLILLFGLGAWAIVQKFKSRTLPGWTHNPSIPPLSQVAFPVTGITKEPSTEPHASSKRGCFKGCLIATGICVLLVAAAMTFIWHMASLYEKQPKQPGEWELYLAEKSINAFENKEAFGNTPEAEELAEGYARQLRVIKQLSFSDPGGLVGDLNKGRFLTHCNEKPDSVVIIVHVPGLRRFSDDAKLTLEEEAWILATHWISSKRPKVTKLALGLKGELNYSSIVTGRIETAEPLKGIEKRHAIHSTKALWPFYIPEVPAAGKKAQ